MRFVSLLSSVYLFVYAGDMVWLFTSNQANEPIAVIWWAEVIASAGFAVFGLIVAILSARKLWREEVYETIDVKGTEMTEQVPSAGGKDSAMSDLPPMAAPPTELESPTHIHPISRDSVQFSGNGTCPKD